VEAQENANLAYSDPKKWASMAIRNVAGSGKFSSDRTITQYAEEIWKLERIRPMT
jgi:starch phosphorylase